ncbi:PfkB family carbohydrate kinase [Angustibacter sp. Root456]|uniref:PfkB family carbohydrate kinase n=1 Tax=Angustibacter sp. Root456 TaxID=1736539 RepID=UPI001910A374
MLDETTNSSSASRTGSGRAARVSRRARHARWRRWRRSRRLAAVPVAKVVDTNGAGDAFMAGFLHATLDGSPVPQALRAGAQQAARSLGTPHLSPLLDTVL